MSMNAAAAAFAGLALLAPLACSASSDSSWTALDKAAQAACSKQIVLMAGKAKVTGIAGRISGIGGDGDLYYGLIVKSTVAGYPEDWLCLYDKHSKKAQAREIQKR
jgi:hypothetical protein